MSSHRTPRSLCIRLDPPSHQIIQPAPSRTSLVLGGCIEVASFPPRFEPRSATGFPVLRSVTGDIRINWQSCGLHTSCI